MDSETKTLLTELLATPTDLARIIEHVITPGHPRELWLAPATVAAWQSRAPEAWQKASAWLARRQIEIRWY